MDARRNDVVLSNFAFSAPGWFILNEPPMVNLPRNHSVERVSDPQYVKLEWFPRHLGSLNAAFAARYKIELFPMRVPGINPNHVALGMQPDFFDEVTATSIFLSFDNYLLEPGVQYAWRVQAVADDGLTLFQNNGYSEVHVFTWGNPCPVPENITATLTGAEAVALDWASDPRHTGYELQFRAKEGPGPVWNNRESFTNNLEINNLLTAGKHYECRVKARCNSHESGYSSLFTFELPGSPLASFQCGVVDEDTSITNKAPKLGLWPGDVVHNGRFPVRLVEVRGGHGVFSGVGRLMVPFLNNIQVLVEFDNIAVNELDQVVRGEMRSIYNPDSRFLINPYDYLVAGNDVGWAKTGLDSAAIRLDHKVQGPSDIQVKYDGNKATIMAGGKTTVAVLPSTKGGTSIMDAEGNLYAVDDKGNVAHIGKSANAQIPAGLPVTDFGKNQEKIENLIIFEQDAADLWAFDSRKNEYSASALFDNKYENINGLYVPWKLIPAGKFGKVKARLDGGLDPEKVRFITSTGTEYYPTADGRAFSITMVGGKAGDAQELYAVYQESDSAARTLGKLSVATYPWLKRKVTLVPVTGSLDEAAARKSLNDIYNPYGIEWEVTVAETFEDTDWDLDKDGKLETKSSNFVSVYSAEMRALNNAYKAARGIDGESVYIFYFNEGDTKVPNLAGDMPVGYQFGYVFTKEETAGTINKTLAHELGHGSFQLDHTFKAGIPQGGTDNLMDYSPGTELVKYQWDAVFDPQKRVLKFMQGDEDGEFEIITHQNLVVAALTKIEGGLLLNERNFKVIIATGLLADGGSILCDINKEMGNVELTEDLSNYLNSKLVDIYRIYNSPLNVIKEQWVEFWSTPIEFPNMRNVFRRSWQYGQEMKQSTELIAEYGKAVYSSNFKFDKLVITPNNKFKIEIKDLTLLEDPDLCFNLLFRMQDYVTVDGEIKSLSLNGQGIDLIPELMSTNVNVSTKNSLGIKYVNLETQKELFEITFDLSASLVNSVELVMSLNDVPINFPLTCESERTDIHFDNKFVSSQVFAEWSKINNQLSKLSNLSGDNAIDIGIILHNVADFYAHSNFITEYIRWWMEEIKKPSYKHLKIESLRPDDLPTYDDVITNAPNQYNLNWGAFWQYYKPIMKTGAWDLGLMLKHLNEEDLRLPRNVDFHDNVALDSPDTEMGKQKPHPTALCNYYQFARGAAYKHIYQILKDKLN